MGSPTSDLPAARASSLLAKATRLHLPHAEQHRSEATSSATPAAPATRPTVRPSPLGSLVSRPPTDVVPACGLAHHATSNNFDDKKENQKHKEVRFSKYIEVHGTTSHHGQPPREWASYSRGLRVENATDAGLGSFPPASSDASPAPGDPRRPRGGTSGVSGRNKPEEPPPGDQQAAIASNDRVGATPQLALRGSSTAGPRRLPVASPDDGPPTGSHEPDGPTTPTARQAWAKASHPVQPDRPAQHQ